MRTVQFLGLTCLLCPALCQVESLSAYGAPGAGADSDALQELSEAIPGQPGEDYPVYSVPPETSFSCDGYIEGYYADPEAECQTFHICANDGIGGLLKYSFLCPNGTIFNQQYFICDWWFNVDCSQAEDYYALNEEVAAAAAASTAAQKLLGGAEIQFPSRQIKGSGVIPGQSSGLRPRNGRRDQISQLPVVFPEDDSSRSGNGINAFQDDTPFLGLSQGFPQDNIPIQLRGGGNIPANTAIPNRITLKLKSSSGKNGRRGLFRKNRRN